MIGIIVGAGRIGYNLAKSMAEDHDITIIEKDKIACEKASDTLDCYVIQGTGTNTQILNEADIKKADFFVAVTGNDEVNLLSSVYAKDHGVKKIVSRLNNTEHEDIFKKLKIKTVNPEKSATRFIARTIIRPSVQTLATLEEGDAEIIELIVKNNNLLYTPISEIENNTDKYKISLLAIKKMNEEKVDEEKGSIGFDYEGLLAVYPKLRELYDKFSPKYQYVIKKYMNWKPSDFINQPEEEVKKAIDILGRKLYVYLPDIIMANSGGHPSITNLTGFGYLNEEISIRKRLDKGENPYEKSKYKKDPNEKSDALSIVILKSIAKDVIKYLSGEKLEPKKSNYKKYYRKEINKSPKNESISNERLANREAIKYIKSLDNKILENLNPCLEEDFYISLLNKYDNYEHKRNIFTKNQIFKALNESLKNNNVSNSLKDYIKNILI